MPTSKKDFQSIVGQLERFYGQQPPPVTTDPFEMIVLENIAYLVSDEKRYAAFEALLNRVGLSAEAIVAASDEELLECTELGGMLAGARVNKLRTIAQITLREFEGDLKGVLKQQPSQAKKALRQFPGIGAPGAEKILLFSRTQTILALESNGLRVMVRLGFGEEQKNYAATYRSVQEAVKGQMKEEVDWLITAHQLLRRHGQELCKRARPMCTQCPIANVCLFYKSPLKRA